MAKKLTNAARIRKYMASHPNAKPKAIAEALKISVGQIYVERTKLKKKSNTITLPPATSNEIKFDPVNHPAHYKAGGIETIDFIEAKGLNYNLGNVVKYITRSDLKGNRKQDLEKAMWYLKREIGA